MDGNQLYTLTSNMFIALISQGVDGEIANLVIAYLLANYETEQFKLMMVPAALLIRHFSEQTPLAIPYSILALVPLDKPFVDGHDMLWPLRFPLP